MPLSKEKGILIAVFSIVIVLLTVGAIIIIQYPEVLDPPEKPALQILSRDAIVGRNESGNSVVNASFTVVIKNTGISNESKILICSVTFQTESDGVLTCDNRTLVSLVPGETRTFYSVVVLPDSAKSVSWSLGTALE